MVCMYRKGVPLSNRLATALEMGGRSQEGGEVMGQKWNHYITLAIVEWLLYQPDKSGD